jgi:23S rRNA U2552 (ribose-2'-O)-methylase RlmE/FtsJ
MKRKIVLDYILDAFCEEEFLKIDGHDNAVIGVDLNSMRLIYSVSGIIKNLRNEMTEPEAVEFFEYNIAGAYLGDKTPILCEDYF